MPLDTPRPASGLSPVGQAIITSFEKDDSAPLTTFMLSDLLCKVAMGATDASAQGVFAMLMAAFVTASGAGVSFDEFGDIMAELTARDLLNLLPEEQMREAREFNRTVVHLMNENMEDLLDAMPDPLNS